MLACKGHSRAGLIEMNDPYRVANSAADAFPGLSARAGRIGLSGRKNNSRICV
jgi:hypothetical protein